MTTHAEFSKFLRSKSDFLNAFKTAFKREPTVEEMLQVFPQGPNQGASGLWFLALSGDTSDVAAFWDAFKQSPIGGLEMGPTAKRRDRFKHALFSPARQNKNFSALFFLLKKHPSVGIEIYYQFKEDIPISELLSVPNILEQIKASENFPLMIYILKNWPPARKNLLAFLKGKNQFIEMIDQDVFNCLDDGSRTWLWDQRDTLPLRVIEYFLTQALNGWSNSTRTILHLLKQRQLLPQIDHKLLLKAFEKNKDVILQFLELDDLFIKFSDKPSIFEMLLHRFSVGSRSPLDIVLQKFKSSISLQRVLDAGLFNLFVWEGAVPDSEMAEMVKDFLRNQSGIIDLASLMEKRSGRYWWEYGGHFRDLNIPELITRRNELFEGLEGLTRAHTTEQIQPLFGLASQAYNAGYLNAYLDLGTSLSSISSSEAALAFQQHEEHKNKGENNRLRKTPRI